MRKFILSTALAVTACSGGKYLKDVEVEAQFPDQTLHFPEQVTAGNESNFAPDLSPNGAWVVYTSDREGDKDIWEKKVSGGFAHQITMHVADDFAPVVSPNGEMIAFVSRREDAAGDVHVVELGGFSLKGLIGAAEPDMTVVSVKATEDTNPSWFPDSDKIVFAARAAGDKTPQLMTAELDDYKAVPIDGARGDQPSVSPDGKRIVYVQNGGLFIWHEDGGKVEQITRGGLLQDGQPRFSQDGKSLVFTRYADDTNNDGKLNGDDRATVWQLDLETHRQEKHRENYRIVPLTTANFSAYSPQLRPPYLYLGLQTSEGLDIFRLPAFGQGKPAVDLEKLVATLDQVQDLQQKLYLIRRAQAAWATAGQEEAAAEGALLELELLVDGGRRIEATWAHEKLVANFAKMKERVALADVAMIRLDLTPLAYPQFQKELTQDQARELEALGRRVEAVLASFRSAKDELGQRVTGHAMLVQAQILASQRSFFEAMAVLAKVQGGHKADKKLSGLTALYQAQITPATADVETAVRAFRGVVEDYRDDRALVRRASQDAITLLTTTSQDYVEALVKLRTDAKGLPIMPALAHMRISEHFRDQDKPAVSANELRQIVDSYPESPDVTLDAAERLSLLEEQEGRFDAAEKMLQKLNEGMKTSRSEHRKRAQELLIDFVLRRGESLLRDKKPELATKEYKKVVAIDPVNVNAHRGLLDAAYIFGTWEDLRDYYEEQANENDNSAEWRYIYAYALTYEIDECGGTGCKIGAIQDAIDEVLEARGMNSQLFQAHQTLGWLDLQLGYWLRRREQSGSVLAAIGRRWNILKGTFGAADPNWLMAGIDSFQTAYFLAKPDSIEQASLAQNLGQAFYELGNFQKALSYYMRRIRLLPVIPMRDAKAEGFLWRRAGRAAFQTDELELAEALQRRALSVWESLSDDEQIAHSLDTLALTVRERGRYKDALAVYERLLAMNEKLGKLKNVVGTYSSIGYTHFLDGQWSEALVAFEKAEDQIAKVRAAIDDGDLEEEDFSTSAIRAPMPEVTTAPKGFPLNRRAIVALDFKAKIYEKLGRPDLQLKTMEQKLALMDVERERMIDEDGYAETVLAEDVAICLSHIGELRLQAGLHTQAKTAFELASRTAKELRPETQAFMTPGEHKNRINAARVQLRLAQLGLLTAEETERSITELETEAAALKPIFAEGALSEGRPIAQMLTLSASLRAAASAKADASRQRDSLKESLQIVAQVEPTAAARRGPLLAAATTGGGATLASDEAVGPLVKEFETKAAETPELEWKILAGKAEWVKAFDALDRWISSGGILRAPTDRRTARVVFEELLGRGNSSADDPSLLLRRYLRIRHLDLVRRSLGEETKAEPPATGKRYKVSSGLERLVAVKDDAKITAALGESDTVLFVHRTLGGRIWGFAYSKGKKAGAAVDAKGRDPDDPAPLSSLLDSPELRAVLPAKGARLYVAPSAELYDLAWELLRVDGVALGQRNQLAFIPSPDQLPEIYSKRSLPKQTIGHIAWPNKSPAPPAEDAARAVPVEKPDADGNTQVKTLMAANATRFYSRILPNGEASVAKRFAQFDVIHVDAPYVLNDVEPGRSVIQLVENPRPKDHVNDATIRQLAALELGATSALILARVDRMNRQLAPAGEGADGWVLTTMAAAEAGISTVLMLDAPKGETDEDDPETSNKAGIDWASFYALLDTESVAEAAVKIGLPGRIHGYGGIPSSEEIAYAEDNIEDTTDEAEELWEEKNYMAAAGAYKRALFYALRTGKQQNANQYLDRIKKAYFQKREFANALAFQMRLVERMKPSDANKDADPIEYTEALLEAAVVAIKAEMHEEAAALLDEAEKIATTEDEPALLGKVWHYRGISAEAQSKYDSTIEAYEKAAQYYAESNPAQGTQLILSIGNIYASRLSQFTKAIDYYDRAAKDFKARGDAANYVQALTDKSASLMQIGELQQAIVILDKTVIPSLDLEKQRVQWIRATQRLANCYFRAGLYQEARGLNERILDEVEEIEQDAQRVALASDAISLRGLILAKTGKYKESFAEFQIGIKQASEYRLEGQLATLYNNYGFWAREAGNVDQSIELFNLALKIDERAKSRRDIAYDQRNMGFSITLKGDFNRAKDLLRQALKTSEELNLSHNIAYCHFGLGDVALREKKWEDAAESFGKALEVSQKGYLLDFVWRARAGLAEALRRQDELEAARAQYAEAIALVERLRAGLKSEASRNEFYSEAGVQQVYEDYAVVLMKLGRTEEAWVAGEKARSRAFIDSLGTQKLKFAREESVKLVSEEGEARAAVEAVERRLSDLDAKHPDTQKLQTELQAARAKYDEHLQKMRSVDAQLGQFVAVESISKEELAKLLPADTAMVQYLVTEDQLFVWVVHAGAISGATVDVGAGEVEKRVRDFRTLMQNFSTTDYLGKELADILIAPVRDKLEGVKRLAVVPHRNLHFLPFAALPEGDGFLVDRWSLYYLDSATLARYTHTAKDDKLGSEARVLALANPASAVPGQADLPFAEREVEVMPRYFPNVTARTGAEAQEAQLKSAAASADILHIASHGEFLPSAPAESRLLLAPGADADGNLAVSEIFGLPMRAKLVTLSACESGLGKLSAGDEIIGMNRAFLYTGADTVVSALWRISDVASGVTMKRFYRYMSEGDDKAEAMRKAQKVVRRYFKHPAYWSGFRVVGHYR
jgi:CHAT domain-containing protein/Tol biopolymer transport system component